MFVPKQRSIIFDCQNDAAASRGDDRFHWDTNSGLGPLIGR